VGNPHVNEDPRCDVNSSEHGAGCVAIWVVLVCWDETEKRLFSKGTLMFLL